VNGACRRKQNRKPINDWNFMREIAKTKKSEILCCQTHTTVHVLGMDHACRSQMAHTTVCPTGTTMWLVQVSGNPIFRIFNDPNAFL